MNRAMLSQARQSVTCRQP